MLKFPVPVVQVLCADALEAIYAVRSQIDAVLADEEPDPCDTARRVDMRTITVRDSTGVIVKMSVLPAFTAFATALALSLLRFPRQQSTLLNRFVAAPRSAMQERVGECLLRQCL